MRSFKKLVFLLWFSAIVQILGARELKPVFKEKIYEMLIDVITDLTPNIISRSQAIIRNHFSENRIEIDHVRGIPEHALESIMLGHT